MCWRWGAGSTFARPARTVARFTRGKTIVRVDVDREELGWRVPADISIAADVGLFATHLLATPAPDRDWSGWRAAIAKSAADWPDAEELVDVPGINVARFFHAVSAAAAEAVAYVTDVGQNQMWAAQSLRLAGGQRFVTSGGMEAMGFSVPAAIGVAPAAPARPRGGSDGGRRHAGQHPGIGNRRAVVTPDQDRRARQPLPGSSSAVPGGAFRVPVSARRSGATVHPTSPLWPVPMDYLGGHRRGPEKSKHAVRWLLAEPCSPALLHVSLCQESRVRPKVSYGQSVFHDGIPTAGATRSGTAGCGVLSGGTGTRRTSPGVLGLRGSCRASDNRVILVVFYFLSFWPLLVNNGILTGTILPLYDQTSQTLARMFQRTRFASCGLSGR